MSLTYLTNLQKLKIFLLLTSEHQNTKDNIIAKTVQNKRETFCIKLIKQNYIPTY